jgi:transglutaminase-like putative cysteine protease
MDRVNSWRLLVRHSTTSRYAAEVFASYNEVRLTPMTDRGQVTVDERVEVVPAARLFRHVDYWGTIVHTFDVHGRHTELTVLGSSIVDTSARRVLDEDATWGTLALPTLHDDLYEYLSPTRFVAPCDTLSAVADDIRTRAATPADAARMAIDAVRDRLVYERGHTTASTSAAEAWNQRRGVCQDFAHVTLAILRAMGVPARYVSGYLHPDRDAPIGVAVSGESHAWIDAWIGDWAPFDPTNGEPVGERHVVVAQARDYGDVSPLRGIYTGAAATDQDVTVEVTRIG